MYENHITVIHYLYSSLSFKPPPGQYTVAASFFLTSPSISNAKIISLATGTKCLPTSRLPVMGEALHDSHAEILARRGAIRWFLEEIIRCQSSGSYQSPWIYILPEGKYDLREGVQVSLYISSPPFDSEGGDASMRFLASVQDEEMATLKDSTVYPTLNTTEASRGRDNYSRLGVLRTKPGRADSPPTLCMSCSDKIASWNVLGFQGALAARFLKPLYLSTVIIGDIPTDMQNIVREDCERALWGRIGHIQGYPGYTLHIPSIKFTTQPFIHSRAVIEAGKVGNTSCNESLSWVADSTLSYEVLINGMKRGVPPKHRFRLQSRPRLSKASMLNIYSEALKYSSVCSGSRIDNRTVRTYYQIKQSVLDYQAAKEKLIGIYGPFSGWVRSGAQWESFNSETLKGSF